jgi:hypothetical protein
VWIFLPLLLACDLKPPPKPPPLRPKAPLRTPKVRTVSDAAGGDTGEMAGGSKLVRRTRYTPAKPTAFDDITIEVDVLPTPGKRVDVDYTWTVNGRKLLSERSKTLSHRHFEKGDDVAVTLTVEAGGAIANVPVHTIRIINTPPRILTKPKTLTRLDGFRIRAEDPDGDSVHYSVKGAPKGLTVGETTGVFRYKPSNEAEGGVFDIRMIVGDGDGAESEWRLQVNIRGGSKSKSEIAKRKAKDEAAAKAAEEARAARAAEAAAAAEAEAADME